MRRRVIASAAAVLLSASAAHAEPKAQPAPVAGKTTTMERDGRTYLVSKGTGATAFLTPMPDLNEKGSLGFLLVVVNTGGHPFDLTEASVSARDQGGQAVPLITREKLLAAGRAKSHGAQFAEMRAMQAVGGSRSSPSMNMLGAPGVAAPAAPGTPSQGGGAGGPQRLDSTSAAPTNPEFRSTGDPYVDQRTIKAATVAPGQSADTFVTFDKLDRRDTALEVQVATGPDVHVFRFNVDQ